MPAPLSVVLVPHDPRWAQAARAEAERILTALPGVVSQVHHIGSTAISGLAAKPILDLLPVAISLAALDAAQPLLEGLGYEWWGEFGLDGRRYCTLTDPKTGRRIVQVHAYEAGSPDVLRHLVFRDYLRARPDLAAEYEQVKRACRDAHPDDSHAYGDCKGAWVARIEAEALVASPSALGGPS